MLEALKTFNARTAPHLPARKLKIGIGIHTGEALVGNIGGKKRIDYTALGDNVNLASRLEGLTKKYGVSVLVTKATLKNISNCTANGPHREMALEKINVITRIVDEAIVKGKTKSVKIYEPMIKTKENEQLKKRFEIAFAHYRKGNFEKALTIFNELKNKDPLSEVYIKRINALNLGAKEKEVWDGIWRWDEK